MLNESIAHYSETINSATRLISGYFQKSVRASKIIQLSEPDRRNVILRIFIDNPTTGMPQSFILKKNSIEKQIFEFGESETETEQLNRFAHDWAGIEFLSQIGSNHVPKFYAGNIEHRFILIEDLGLSHPSLVGPLTRAPSVINVQEATSCLSAYVRRLGKMQVDTLGKASQFTAILNRVYPQAQQFNFIPEIDIATILKQFKVLIGNKSKELNQEIQNIVEFSNNATDFKVLLHGDICPDNVYYQKNEIRFIDFEFADFGQALIDGVYLRMSMPSCWCSKSVPENILQQMEAIYHEELKSGIVSAGDDSIYNKQLVYACGYWAIRTLKQIDSMKLIENEWICPSGPVDIDSEWKSKENAFRPRILSRLETFINAAKIGNHFPKLCEASIHLLSHLRKIWPETKDIDVFPVFSNVQ